MRRIDAKYIHETTTWPTKWQPFIPWVHEETDYLGERDMRGTVPDAKDAQRGLQRQRLKRERGGELYRPRVLGQWFDGIR